MLAELEQRSDRTSKIKKSNKIASLKESRMKECTVGVYNSIFVWRVNTVHESVCSCPTGGPLPV